MSVYMCRSPYLKVVRGGQWIWTCVQCLCVVQIMRRQLTSARVYFPDNIISGRISVWRCVVDGCKRMHTLGIEKGSRAVNLLWILCWAIWLSSHIYKNTVQREGSARRRSISLGCEKLLVLSHNFGEYIFKLYSKPKRQLNVRIIVIIKSRRL